MGRRDKVLWFEYKKETNIFCVATFSVVLVLFIASKLPVKAVVGTCIADYVLFVGKELFYANHGGLCFFEVYGVIEINLLRIALCVMFSLIVMTYRILLQFEFPHFSNRYHLKPNPAKHSASVSCCDCSFFKRNPFMPECVLARTRSMA